MSPPALLHRAIALDLDGTALDSTGALRARTISAVARANVEGVETILVTGRHHGAAHVFHAQLCLTTPTICCNGAYLYDYFRRAVVVGTPLLKPAARKVVEICLTYDCMQGLYVDDAMIFKQASPHFLRLNAWGAALPAAVRPIFEQTLDFRAPIERGEFIWKVLASSESPGQLADCRRALEETGEVETDLSWNDRLDIGAPGVNKARRLSEWASARGISPGRVLAFGDNENDVGMLRAFRGVAVGNAIALAQQAAGRIIGDNNSDAIAETIESWLDETAAG